MSELIVGDDGLPAVEVGIWAKEKHDLLCRYIDIAKAVRAKFLPPNKGGAAYIELFCGPGRCLVRETGEWIDGSAVAAWKKSLEGKEPFTRVIIGDADPARLAACEKRLRALDAPVMALSGEAKDTVFRARQAAPAYGLNLAFLDPFNLESLDFGVIETLAKIKRVDIMVHVSAMDLQRNLDKHLTDENSAFDVFAPGWRSAVNQNQSPLNIRREVFSYWREKVAGLGIAPSTKLRLVTGSKNQPLYWLLLAARHELAHKFWNEASDTGQRSFF